MVQENNIQTYTKKFSKKERNSAGYKWKKKQQMQCLQPNTNSERIDTLENILWMVK